MDSINGKKERRKNNGKEVNGKEKELSKKCKKKVRKRNKSK